ncbi:T-cell immunoglobulin and mucin domain-containing protein 4 isoform 2 precursor [Homo sapiens]|uniref:Isoform 2 of T-cell immunoglobulin and mucin domain-containing protein 4 n=1 Tax=Homo sapiens TaxID=9606 RepID=Q96H15-2|nr:T-cell immunoglobulin and mucin domain-containing protein 4 isoform 2 precursor [Homo sapiens]|eukprot:NP_001140198.1 T-cell immunoglobulin and mucin domain-containing protein 4 isoform 2 precursor [Homo sapiens]
MSKEPLILWLMIEFWWLYLTPVTSETVVTEVLGHRVTLPCLYSSWSHNSNSMCWGKDQCPYSGCKEALIRTDGMRVTSRKSAKYRLQGTIPRGDVSLTILNPSESDSGVYCCRIEVPGWFNDVKINVRLNLQRASTTTHRTATTTTRRTTTTSPTTTRQMTTTPAALPTTVVTTPDLTTGTPLQMTTIAVFTTANTCLSLTPSTLPEEATGLLTPEPSKEGPILTAESETVLPSDSWSSVESTSADTVLLTSKASDTAVPEQNKTTKTGQMDGIPMSMKNEMPISQLLMIIAPSLGFVLFALFVAFLLRGKLMETYCSQKHTRLDYIGDSKNVLNDVQHGREDEDGLFTL